MRLCQDFIPNKPKKILAKQRFALCTLHLLSRNVKKLGQSQFANPENSSAEDKERRLFFFWSNRKLNSVKRTSLG